tara:strand:- start:997 stop:1125 length:129 start_codon:yes stop_codon:yes gene_type:complete
MGLEKIIKDTDDGSAPVRLKDDYIDDVIQKINEIIDWINSQS